MAIYKTIKGHGEPIVVLHGWGCNHWYMQPIVQQLSNRYTVINIDLPGRGQSDWQQNIQTIHDIADLVIEDLPETANYVGWSFGSLVCFSIAARYPKRVRRIVGVCSTPKYIEDESWPGVAKPGFKSGFSKALQGISFNNFLKAYFDSEFAAFDQKPSAYHELIALLAREPHPNLEVLLKGLDICDKTDLRNEFSSLRCAVDLIEGQQDNNVPVLAFEKIKTLNSSANIHIVQNAQHMPFWTHQIEFNKILNQIL